MKTLLHFSLLTVLIIGMVLCIYIEIRYPQYGAREFALLLCAIGFAAIHNKHRCATEY